jgi:hypothetical protein
VDEEWDFLFANDKGDSSRRCAKIDGQCEKREAPGGRKSGSHFQCLGSR